MQPIDEKNPNEFVDPYTGSVRFKLLTDDNKPAPVSTLVSGLAVTRAGAVYSTGPDGQFVVPRKDLPDKKSKQERTSTPNITVGRKAYVAPEAVEIPNRINIRGKITVVYRGIPYNVKYDNSMVPYLSNAALNIFITVEREVDGKWEFISVPGRENYYKAPKPIFRHLGDSKDVPSIEVLNEKPMYVPYTYWINSWNPYNLPGGDNTTCTEMSLPIVGLRPAMIQKLQTDPILKKYYLYTATTTENNYMAVVLGNGDAGWGFPKFADYGDMVLAGVINFPALHPAAEFKEGKVFVDNSGANLSSGVRWTLTR